MSSLESIRPLQSQLATQRALLDRLQKAFDASGFNAELLPFDKKTFTREEGLAIDAFNKRSASAAVAGGFRTVAEFLNKTFLNNIKRAQFEIDRIKSEINRISKRIPLVNPVDQITTTDEDQFLHAPTDTFEAIGIQADPLPISVLPEDRPPTGQLLLKMNQTSFPAISETFEGVNGTVTFNIAVDPRVFGSGKRFSFRILVHNLTGNDRTERKISFEISQTRQSKRIKYLVPIPPTAERIRIELQAFTDNGFPASNVFNETHIKKGTPPPPTPVPPISERECNCRGVIKKVRIGEPCPVCKELPPEPEKKNLFAQIGFETLIIGGLAVAALMPRGDKKK